MSERSKKLAELATKLNQAAARKNPERGEPVLFLAADRPDLLDLGVLATGNPVVDRVIGGGFPRGTIGMLVGPQGTGKSCLTLDMIAHNQLLDPDFYAAFVNLESRAFPTQAAEQAGVHMDRLLVVSGQESGERTLDIVLDLLYDMDAGNPKNLVDLVVIDSIAAIAPDDEIKALREEGLAKHTVGRQAALVSKLLRAVSGCGCLGRACLLLVNQIRVDIGGYGSPETMPGGKAILHYPKIILRMTKPGDGTLKEGDRVTGHTVRVQATKNNTARAHPQAEGKYEVVFGQGVSKLGPVVDQAIDRGVIVETSTGRFTIERDGKTAKIHGRTKLLEMLKEDPDLLAWVESQCTS